MKRSDNILFTILGIVLFIVLVVNVVLALASEEKKSGPVQVIMENYFAIGNTLSQDSFKGLDKDVQSLKEAASHILKNEKSDSDQNKEYWSQIRAIRSAAEKFVSKDLKSSRESYKALSAEVASFVRANGFSDPAYSFYCPMVNRTWFQSEEKIANPFYGSQMLRCGMMTGMTKGGKYMEKTKDMPAGQGH